MYKYVHSREITTLNKIIAHAETFSFHYCHASLVAPLKDLTAVYASKHRLHLPAQSFVHIVQA